MKSLLVVSTLDHIVRPLKHHLDGAREAGYRVDVACRFTRFRDELAAHADALHDLPMQRFPLHPANVVALTRLITLIRRRSYTVVHCHNPTGGFVGRLAATLSGVHPLRVYTAHGFHFHPEGGRLGNALYRAVETVAGHALSDAVLVVNQDDFSAARSGVVPPERVFSAGGGGIDTARYDPARISDRVREQTRAALQIPAGAQVLSVVAEMIPRKRHEDALRAMVRIGERFPEAVLVLAGDGALLESLQKLAQTLGIAHCCRFPGFTADVVPLLGISDLFVFPSKQEGLPFCVQEALSTEVPVVAADIRGTRDLVTSQCGRLVPPCDPVALADAAIAVLELPEERRREMGRRGRANMIAERDNARCVADWLAVYDTLLARREKR